MRLFNLVRAMQFYHLSRKGAVLLIGVILAKSSLNLEEIGLYETLMFLAMILSFFWVESFIKGYLSVFHEWNEDSRQRSVFSLYLLFMGLSGFLTLILWLFQDLIIPILTGYDQLHHLGWLLVYLLLYQPTTITAFILQLKHKTADVFIFAIIHSLGLLVAVGLPVFLEWGVGAAMQGLVLFAALMHIYSLIILRKYWIARFSNEALRMILTLGLPLILYALIQSFASVFDAWLVNFWYESKASFALYRFGARELPLVVPMAVGVSNLAIPLLNHKPIEGRSLLKIESRKLMHFIFPLAIVLTVVSPYLFEVVYNTDFQTSSRLFNVYLLLIIPQLIFPQTFFLSAQRSRILVVVGIAEVLFNVVMSILLVQNFGMVGIAWATVAAFLIEKLTLIALVDHYFDLKPSDYVPLKTSIFYSLALVATYLISGYYQGFLMG